MRFSIRSGRSAFVHPPALCRTLRGEARGTDAAALRTMVCFAAFVALLFFAVPAQADEIASDPSSEAEPAPEAEPETEPESEPEPEAEAEPEPEPEPEPAVASEDEGISEPRWIPSIDVGFEIFDYNTKTTVRNFINPPVWAGTQPEASRQTMFRIGGELMGPAFEDLPGRPRLFVQGGVQIRTFASDETYAVDNPVVLGQPETELRTYDRKGNFKNRDLPFDFNGQGSDVFGIFQDPSWYAAVGLAFSVPIARNLLLQIKPSLEYSLEKVDFTGRFTTVNELNPHLDPNSSTPTRNFVVVRGNSDQTTTDHSVGAGLEFALVPFRKVRPIRVSIYAEARFMWIVSGPTTDFIAPNGAASFSVVRDDLGIKGGAGVRFSWVGFD